MNISILLSLIGTAVSPLLLLHELHRCRCQSRCCCQPYTVNARDGNESLQEITESSQSRLKLIISLLKQYSISCTHVKRLWGYCARVHPCTSKFNPLLLKKNWLPYPSRPSKQLFCTLRTAKNYKNWQKIAKKHKNAQKFA